MAQAETNPVAPESPPADARHYLILSTAGRHGTAELWRAPDGRRMGRLHVELRGMVWDETESIGVRPDGTLLNYRLRGTSPNGDVAESFDVADGRASWASPFDSGTRDGVAGAFYVPAGWAIGTNPLLLERLLSSRRDLSLLPGGTARSEELTRLKVSVDGRPEVLTAWSVTGIFGTPWVVWTDARHG
ncbi:MAG: hypothetical protein ABIV63_08390, partial [Caldimonas sp.]